MKVQKVNFKKVILLLLLLSGSLNFSFPVATAAVVIDGQEELISPEFSEQLQDMREGSLPAVVSLNFYGSNYSSAVLPYQYLSIEEAKRSSGYIRSSKNIDPGLDASEIIYPFHYFL